MSSPVLSSSTDSSLRHCPGVQGKSPSGVETVGVSGGISRISAKALSLLFLYETQEGITT